MARYDAARRDELGEADEVQFGSGRPRRPGPRWLLIAAGAALVAVVVVRPIGHSGKQHARQAPVVVSDVRPGILGVHAGWELLGYGPRRVVRIEFARGRVTRTAVPEVASTGPASFVVGPDQAIIRPLDFVPGYLVPDGQRARGLSAAFSNGGTLIPGPRPGEVWVQAGYNVTSISLVRLDGVETGTSLRVPGGGPWLATPDGRGYVVLQGANGSYDVQPGGLIRIAGSLSAVGPTRWLTVMCRRPHRCANVVVSPASGARRILPGPAAPPVAPAQALGAIAPDGSAAAVFRIVGGNQITLHLLSLRSGTDRLSAVTIDQDGPDTLAWSPDSRWLFVVAAHGALAAVNARTGRVARLGVTLPPLTQIAIRGPAR